MRPRKISKPLRGVGLPWPFDSFWPTDSVHLGAFRCAPHAGVDVEDGKLADGG